MSSNSFISVTENGDLGATDWGCLAGRLYVMAVRQATLVSDESALEACACSQLCAIQIDDLYLLPLTVHRQCKVLFIYPLINLSSKKTT